MKHKTLRTLLCVILTVCFCLSAIAPVSAAGLFSGDSGAASIFDEWIRSLKDRFTEIQPGNDATPVANETAAGNEFIRIFHLDCGRKYFTVDQIKGIIDELAANNYTHIELAFGNDGFRFLLDDMSVGEYTSEQVKSAIQAGNKTYAHAGELTETEMDDIIAYAKKGGKNNGHSISVIPMVDVPGHANALMTAMTKLGIFVSTFYEESNNGLAFDVSNKETTSFVTALLTKYIEYFSKNDCEYFNLGADECGYNVSGFSYSSLIEDLLSPLGKKIADSGMTPLMFNDGFRSSNNLQTLVSNLKSDDNKPIFAICYWTANDDNGYATAAQLANDFQLINTNTHWYYIAGNEGYSWGNYNYAIVKMKQDGFKANNCDSDTQGKIMPMGCMLAFWCDQPGNGVNYSNLYTYIKTLSEQNPTYFTAPVTPVAPTITASKTTLTVGNTATLSISTGAAATWSVDNTDVVELSAAVTAAGETVTATAKAKGTAVVSADVGGTALSVTLTVNEPGEVTWEHEQTITVTVNNTVNIEISGVNYSGEAWETDDPTIATVVSVTGKDAVEAKEVYTATEVTYSTLAKNAKNNQDWIKTDYYYKKNNDHYPVYVKKERSKNTTYYYYGFSVSDSAYAVEAIGNKTSESSQTVTVYTKTSTDAVPASTTFAIKGLIAGKSTSIVIGNTKYTINVIAEDLSSVTPLPIQLWITNNTIEGSGTNAKTTDSGWGGDSSLGGARYISVPATTANATSSVYSEAGMLVVDAFAAAGMTEPLTRYEWGGTRFITAQEDKAAQDLVFWTGRIHNSTDSNIQKVWGDDYSTSGDAFTYVRYYGKTWSVSADGVNWTDVTGNGSTGTYSNCKQQLAAYYMTRTKITDEVTTDVADWGKPEGSSDYTSQVSTDFVLLDFAVKYEGGTRNPDTFPVESKTLAYHCASGDAAVGTKNSTDYRMLFNFRGIETGDYEVYMVTVTMTNDSASTQLTSTEAKNGYTYAGEEKVVWAIDTDTYDKSGLNPYESLSNNYSFDVTDTKNCIGGDPYVRGVDVYNKHGALITYYIRAVQKKDSLTVNYFVEGVDTPFYSYSINVDANATHGKNVFNPDIRLNTQEWKGNLEDGDVINIKGNTEWVSANLETMPVIGAQYRFSKYECVRVVRESDKVVNLYYTFTANASFVVDFGLPITITPTDLSANLTNANITGAFVSDTPYATVKMDGKNIIYQLNKPLDRVDTFTITYKGTNQDTLKEGNATFTVNIIPATNVLYEENFINVAENSVWEQTGTAITPDQDLENIDNQKNVYGYDPAYGDDVTPSFSMNGVRKTTVTLTADEFSKKSDDALAFTFEGDGYDLISACGSDTGHLYVRTSMVNEDGTKTLKAVSIIDTYFSGDNTGIIEYGTLDYQVPVIRKMNLDYGKYEVEVYGYLRQSSGAMNPTQSANNIATYASLDSPAVIDYELETNSIVEDILADFGDTNLSGVDVTVTFMDVNSVLNGGTGVQTCNIPKESMSKAHTVYDVQASASDYKAGSAVVYVDGFRVYNPIDITKTNATDATEAAKNEAKTAAAAYEKNNESKVKYYSLYDFVETSINDLGEYNNKTAIYVEYDGDTGKYTIADYKEQGPNNEIYLTAGNAIAFALAGYPEDDKDVVVQYSARAVTDGAMTDETLTVMSSTEMYYSVEVNENYDFDNTTKIPYVIITNSGEGVLAVSGLKVSEYLKPYASAELADKVINSLNPSTETSFVPTTLKVTTPGTVKINRNFSIRIDASAYKSDGTKDVAKVTIVEPGSSNEKELTASNTKAVASGRSMNYRYSQIFKQTTAGEYTYTIYAYNSNGVKSDPVTVTIMVQ